MKSSLNESGALQRLSKRETRVIIIKSHIIAWWTLQKELHWPILYRWGKKILKYVGVEL